MSNQNRWSEAAAVALAKTFGDKLHTSAGMRQQYGETLGTHPVCLPDAVLLVESTEDVIGAVTICNQTGCPIVAHGAGTSVEGHVSAVEGGLVLDFRGMDRILEVNPDDMDCRVQPGVTRERLNEELRDVGLFFPVDPGANATLGGMAATGASGTTTVRYGSMIHNVMGLEVITADGRLIRTGGRARKSSAGYNLTKLFVGSEGTLGIFTELTLKLYPIPQAKVVATCSFPTLTAAVDAAIEIMQYGLGTARIELVDAGSIQAMNGYSHTELPPGDYLFLEFHGSEPGVQHDTAQAQEIAASKGGSSFTSASTTEAQNRLWKARHTVALAALAAVPNARMLATDLVVPLSKLATCLAETQGRIDAEGLVGGIAGHVGDGSFHVGFVMDREDDATLRRVEEVHHWMVRRAIELGGTCTGEHGIGLGKQDYLIEEHGEGVAVMQQIKAALDPNDILNPDKIFKRR